MVAYGHPTPNKSYFHIKLSADFCSIPGLFNCLALWSKTTFENCLPRLGFLLSDAITLCMPRQNRHCRRP